MTILSLCWKLSAESKSWYILSHILLCLPVLSLLRVQRIFNPAAESIWHQPVCLLQYLVFEYIEKNLLEVLEDSQSCLTPTQVHQQPLSTPQPTT